MEYTAIGDTVNTASRVEGLTKTVGCSLLLTGATRAALTAADTDLADAGEHAIRGRQGLVHLWSPTSVASRTTTA